MKCNFCHNEPCSCPEATDKREESIQLSTTFNGDKTETKLPGAMIFFKSVNSTGSKEDEFGVGDMDISLHRPGEKYPWLDLGQINYSNPSLSQYRTAVNTVSSKGSKPLSDINRRLSKKQAQWLFLLIQEMLTKEFAGVIPADDEIDDLVKERFPDKRL